MKTALEELIDDLENLQKDAKGKKATEFEIAMTFAIARAKQRLEKEKEQINQLSAKVTALENKA